MRVRRAAALPLCGTDKANPSMGLWGAGMTIRFQAIDGEPEAFTDGQGANGDSRCRRGRGSRG
ncbi:hypothetical protein GCM10017624_38550 [Azotobacter vinelandii]|nr:hypothetical protein GCM10017624_38550 [Azotobacter vinelandii]